jgi:MFS family permease
MNAPASAQKSPSPQTLRALDGLNFFLADVQSGVGPFLAIYLAGFKWDQQQIGTILTAGGIAGILSQAPVGALVDKLRAKRALITASVACLAVGALTAARMSVTLSLLAHTRARKSVATATLGGPGYLLPGRA